jgi:hypothetical protein
LFLSLPKAGNRWASGTDFMLSLIKCASSASMKSSNMEASATLRRDQILFFEIDWDLKPKINIHTLHITEHLVAIYFKGRVVFFSHQGVGQVGEMEIV